MKTISASFARASMPVPVNRESPLPLHRQALGGLRDWIEGRPRGFRLPGERQLAAAVGVNRATLRKAVARLVKEGLLLRRPGRGQGTFLTRDMSGLPGNLASPSDAPHPFIERQAFRPRSKIKVVIFENLPRQRLFWEKAAQRFNQSTAGVEVELIWLSVTVDTIETYLSFIEANAVDVFLAGNSMLEKIVESGAAARIPSALAGLLMSALFEFPGKDDPGAARALDHFIPLHFAMPMAIWNADVDKGPMVDAQGLVKPEAAIRWLAACPKNDRAAAVANPCNLLTLGGVPRSRRIAADAAEAFLAERLNLLRGVGWLDEITMWENRGHRHYCDLFTSGEARAVIGGTFFLAQHLDRAEFTWRSAPLLPAHGMRTACGVTWIAMSPKCDNPGHAAAFIEFLLAEDTQNLLGGMVRNLPVRTQSRSGALGFLRCEASAAGIREILSSSAPWEPHSEIWCSVLSHPPAVELEAFAAGEMNAEGAASACLGKVLTEWPGLVAAPPANELFPKKKNTTRKRRRKHA